jgi:hypothetical protein
LKAFFEEKMIKTTQITLFRFKVPDLLMNVEKNEKIKNCTFFVQEKVWKTFREKVYYSDI